MESLVNFFSGKQIVQKCFCPMDKTQDLQEYRAQFNFFDYYTKTNGFTHQQLSDLKIDVKELEEVCSSFVISNFPQDYHESNTFDHFEKIVPEPNTNTPTRIRTTTIIDRRLEEKLEKIPYELYFIKPIESWACVGGEKIEH